MPRPLTTQLLLLPFMLFPAALAAQNEPDGTLKLATYLDWETVSNPQISPDGSEIIFTKGWVDKINDRRSSSIYIMNADGSRMRVLVEDGSSPKWSPSGDRILYTAGTESEGTEIFVRWMDDEGAATQITHLENSPGNVEWSPDGTRVAFTMSVDSDNPWPISLPGRPAGANWTEGPKVVDRLVYRRDRRGYIDGGYTHLFVVPADGGTARQLTDGDWNHNGVEWTPDGAEILFTSLRVEDAEHEWRQSDIYSVDVASGAITRLTDRSGPDGSPLPSPDGRLIAFTGNDLTTDTYITPKLYVMNRDGSNVRMISDGFDRRGSGMIWAEDGSGFYMTVRSEGTSNLYFASVRGGVRQVTEGNHMLSVSTIGSGMAVGTRTDYQRPGDLISFPLGEPGRITQLTEVNADVLHGVALGDVEEVWYKSVENYDIQGWIIKPPGFDPSKKYPLILAIHGGPHGMYNVGFNFAWQNHAANGYVVLYTNPRGSSGYGSAFGNAIKNAYPGKDFDDLMAGVDLVIDRGYIDDQNMFVYGCSGGGVLTSWVVGHTDRFAAASANCPVTNWLSFVGTTDGASWYRNFEHFPWDDPSEHLRRSPLMYVGNVTTPTMLMTGEGDLRTPMPQTEEYYQALRVLKVPTAMIRFKNEWHGTSSTPSNFLRTQIYLREWFEKHRRGGPVT
ncbi:MAG: S9 family peptidase [Gemmatimonadetes bacterium]|nr:S9 family peptidase [Gemmatimonadota bacterium]MYE70610.1 S9 family peptidase [Gemmatimonadota bacterium]MYJ69948.1 S9 family peptidase [Gemmatimonadota bacterium]